MYIYSSILDADRSVYIKLCIYCTADKMRSTSASNTKTDNVKTKKSGSDPVKVSIQPCQRIPFDKQLFDCSILSIMILCLEREAMLMKMYVSKSCNQLLVYIIYCSVLFQITENTQSPDAIVDKVLHDKVMKVRISKYPVPWQNFVRVVLQYVLHIPHFLGDGDMPVMFCIIFGMSLLFYVILQVMETTECNQNAAIYALHDTDNDLNAAIMLLLETNNTAVR